MDSQTKATKKGPPTVTPVKNQSKIVPQKIEITPRQKLVQNEILLEQNARERIASKKLSPIRITVLKQENKLLRMRIKHEKQLKALQVKSSSSTSLRFNFRHFNRKFEQYAKKQLWVDILMVTAASLLITFGFNYFIAATGSDGIYPPGLSAVARQTALFVSAGKKAANETYYFAIYFILNIPFFIFGVFRVGLKFTFLSVLCLALQNLFNLIMQQFGALRPAKFWLLINYENISSSVLDAHQDNPIYLVWLFVFALIAGLICGAGYSIIYRTGGSTAGTDFVSGYYQKKYNISIASISRIINICLVIIVIFVQSMTISSDNLQHYFNSHGSINNTSELYLYRLRYLLGPTLFASLLFVLVQSFTTNLIYPKYRFVYLRLHTKKPNHIAEALKFRGYNYIMLSDVQYQFINMENWEKINEIKLYVSMLNLKEVMTIIRIVDSNAIVFSHLVLKSKNVNIFKIEYHDKHPKKPALTNLTKKELKMKNKTSRKVWRKKNNQTA